MMHDAGQRRDEPSDDSVRWLAMLARRVCILVVVEVERRFDMEPSLRTKQERQRREREQRAA